MNSASTGRSTFSTASTCGRPCMAIWGSRPSPTNRCSRNSPRAFRRRSNSPSSRCCSRFASAFRPARSEEHTSELQSLTNLVCRLLLEKKKRHKQNQVNEHCQTISTPFHQKRLQALNLSQNEAQVV